MKNEIEIKRDELNKVITFQAKGEIDFLENITRTVITEFKKDKNEIENFAKAYNGDDGYIGEEIEINDKEKGVPEHYKTGVKKERNQSDKYKCRYICPKCGTKENKYLYKYSEYMYCRVCNERLIVSWIDDEYEEEKDSYNNYAYAGKFKPIFTEDTVDIEGENDI